MKSAFRWVSKRREFPWSFLHPSKCVLLSTQSTGCPWCGREQWWPEQRRKVGSATSLLSRPSSPRSTSSDPDVEAFSIMTGFQYLSSTPRSLFFSKTNFYLLTSSMTGGNIGSLHLFCLFLDGSSISWPCKESWGPWGSIIINQSILRTCNI